MSEELSKKTSPPAEDPAPTARQILIEYKSKVTFRVAMIEEREAQRYAAKFRKAGFAREAEAFELFLNSESSSQRHGGARGAYISGELNELLHKTGDEETS